MDQGIPAIRIEDAPDKGPEHCFVVIKFHKTVYFFDPPLFISGLQVEFQYGAVKRFFGWKMLKYNGFGDPGGGGYFLGRRAFKPPPREGV